MSKKLIIWDFDGVISDTEKLADIAGYISRKFTDDILYSIPISLNGSDYFFVHK